MKYLLVLSVVLLVGCTQETDPRAVESAERLCKDHGGPYKIYLENKGMVYEKDWAVAECFDRTRFDWRTGESR